MNATELLSMYERVADAPDAVGKLRRLVLDLALRGKLVVQNATDGSASELLMQIAVERARLESSKRVKAPKTVAVIDEAPFELPGQWRWSSLAEVGVLSPRNVANDGANASFVPMTLISSEYGVVNDHVVRPWRDIKTGYSHFAEGDVGLAKITPCFENGKSTVFQNLTGGLGSGTTELHVVRPILVLPRYVLLFLKSPYFVEGGIPKMTGTAGQKRVPLDYFAAAPFPLPPLAEQHRIVAKVDELMALCDQLDAARAEREALRDRLAAASLARLNSPDPDTFQADARFVLQMLPSLSARCDQVKQLRQSILNLAVHGKLVPQDPSDEPATKLLTRLAASAPAVAEANRAVPFEAPAGWHWATMRHLVLHSDAGWSPKTEDHPRTGDAWGVLKVSAVSWGAFQPSENKEVLPGTQPRLQAQVKRGDFLISRANTAELVARSVIVEEDPVNLMMSDKIVRLCLSSAVDPQFICILNNSANFAREHYARLASGVSPSMKNVSRDVILDLPVPVPPAGEQQRIVAKVRVLMMLCDHLEASLAVRDSACSRLLDALLHEVL